MAGSISQDLYAWEPTIWDSNKYDWSEACLALTLQGCPFIDMV